MSDQMNLIDQKVRIGSRVFKISSDDDYLKHVGDNFEPDMCALFECLIKPDFKILDIGANIGCTTLLFSELGRNVTSFEPSQSTFRILQKNITESGNSNVVLHNFGLGVKSESMELTFAPSNRSGGFVSDLTQASDGHVVEKIEIRNGDAILGDQKFDFVKIDVEGYEMHVIDGMQMKISQSKPIVVLELNHWCVNAFQRISVPDFFDFLLDIFPFVYAVDGDKYLDIKNKSHRYIVMYQHIINFKWPNLVAAFSEDQLEKFRKTYLYGG